MRMIEETKDRIEMAGFAQLVHGPTRFWRNAHPTLIYHVWFNHCINYLRPVADHNLVETSVNLRYNPRTEY